MLSRGALANTTQTVQATPLPRCAANSLAWLLRRQLLIKVRLVCTMHLAATCVTPVLRVSIGLAIRRLSSVSRHRVVRLSPCGLLQMHGLRPASAKSLWNPINYLGARTARLSSCSFGASYLIFNQQPWNPRFRSTLIKRPGCRRSPDSHQATSVPDVRMRSAAD